MILTRQITHYLRNALLVLTVPACILSTGLTARGAEPATMPATQRARIDGDPMSKLAAAAPMGWAVRGSTRVGRTYLHPGRQWSRVSTDYVDIRSPLIHTKEGLQRAAPPIIVWLAHTQAQKAKWRVGEKHRDIETRPAEYLGQGTGYHVYIHLPPGAARFWPTARRDIGKALGIKAATTQPAETAEKRTVLVMTRTGNTILYTLDGVGCADIEAVRKALAVIPRDSSLVIQVETNMPAGRVAEVLAVAKKLRLTKISLTVVRTSPPPAKPKWKPPL